MDDLKKILNGESELNDEQLMNYLEGKASAEEEHAVESSMNESAFINDAVEGLQAVNKGTSLNDYVLQLNKNLHEQLNAQKERKQKRKLKDFPWVIIAVIIVLLLCIMGYVAIRMFS